MGEDLDFLGPWLPPDIVKGIAKGDLDPLTKRPFQVETASSVLVVDQAFSMKNSETIGIRKRLQLPVQKNVLTNYFCLASIQAKRKFRAPKFTPRVLMESSSPSSSNPDSDSPGSDKMPLSSATDQSQDSQLNSGRLNNKLPVTASMNDRLPNRCSKFLAFPLHGGSVGTRCSSPLLESYQDAVKPKSHEEHETELKCTSVENKSVKRNVSMSPFFCDNSLHEVTTGDENKVSCKNKEDDTTVLDDHPVLETSIKKRKTAHLFDVNVLETLPLGNVKSTPLLAGQDNKDENSKNFGRDISHVNDYCGIAEKSMERFVSLMNSFRYSSSGSRASGLRAPLKNIRNTYSMRSNKAPVDFSQFSYKPSKNSARMVSSPSKLD